MASLPIYVADAFTSRPFRGNPAAVCMLEKPLADPQALAIAAEMNLSETAFLVARPTPGHYDLRWFTPKVEVDLCGHATLASAKVLFTERGVHAQSITFFTRSGPLEAVREANDEIRLDFPSNPPTSVQPPLGLLAALGVRSPRAVLYAAKARKLLVEVESPDLVRDVDPDFAALLEATDPLGVRGIIVASRGEQGVDFVSRYFAPWVGVDEDPVTGSAHTVLGPYFGKMLAKQQMRARQVSPRGGELTVRLVGDRVHMVGSAVVVLRGELRP